MHCTFEDEESGRKLEVEFCVGKDGQLSKQNVQHRAEEMQKLSVQ
jgi:hypothetical protein